MAMQFEASFVDVIVFFATISGTRVNKCGSFDGNSNAKMVRTVRCGVTSFLLNGERIADANTPDYVKR